MCAVTVNLKVEFHSKEIIFLDKVVRINRICTFQRAQSPHNVTFSSSSFFRMDWLPSPMKVYEKQC